MTDSAGAVCPPVDVLVPVPARDEAGVVRDCLESVLTSIGQAQLRGFVDRAFVAVMAHRCRDATAARARSTLAEHEHVKSFVGESNADVAVGTVRTRLVAGSLARWPELDPDRTWLFSTDADSVVHPTWISRTLAIAQTQAANAVAGLVDVVSWAASAVALRRYADILAAGMTPHGHHHAYAANLAVDLATFLRIGGFAAVGHGEEHSLLRAIRRDGGCIATPQLALVQTSGRVPGRAEFGLAHLLGALEVGAERLPAESGVNGELETPAAPGVHGRLYARAAACSQSRLMI